jgi:adenylate cyclase
LAQRIIDLADGDATMGNIVVGSPLSVAQMYRGNAELYLGMRGFRECFEAAVATARPVDPTCFTMVVLFKYLGIALGVFLPDDTALRETAEALAIAEQSCEPFAVMCALIARGIALVHRDSPESEAGYDLLEKARAMALAHNGSLVVVPYVDIHKAVRKLHRAGADGAIELARAVLDNMVVSGEMAWRGLATTTLVESLLRRGTGGDIAEAEAAIDRLAAVPTDPGYVMHKLPLLRMRALLAHAQGDDDAYRNYRDRYRKMATDLGFEGHLKWAEEMP